MKNVSIYEGRLYIYSKHKKSIFFKLEEDFLYDLKIVLLWTLLHKIIIFFWSKRLKQFCMKKENHFHCLLLKRHIKLAFQFLFSYKWSVHVKSPDFLLNLQVFDSFLLKSQGVRLCKVGKSAACWIKIIPIFWN